MRVLVSPYVVCVAFWLAITLRLAPGSAQDAGAHTTLDDAAIAAAIERELIGTRSVEANELDVQVRAGIVTLTGSATNLLAHEDAARIAQTVRGVRAVVNRIQVKPPWNRTDAELQGDVRDALHFDPAADEYELDATVESGVVTLKGRVQSFAEREIADRVVRGVRGVRGVRNEVTISYRQQRADPEIKADVEAQLRRDAYLAQSAIESDVTDGRVRLVGAVGTDAERSRAYFDAWVAGVREVDTSKVRIEPWRTSPAVRPIERMNDTAIEQSLSAAFIHDPRVSSFHVEATSKNGVVTLQGVVNNLGARQAAIEDARNVPSVVRVVDRMQVKSPAQRDEEVADGIRKALARDPYLERFGLLVSVIHGTAYLRGTVDSTWAKTRADHIASLARGVRAVRNRLSVLEERAPRRHDLPLAL